MKQKGRAPRPYSRGWRAPWRRQWGVLSDGHCRVAKLAKRIERELVDEHKPTTPRQQRLLHRAAKLEAEAERVTDTMGTDPKSTRRTLTALERTAAALVAQVRAARNGHGGDLDPLFQGAEP